MTDDAFVRSRWLARKPLPEELLRDIVDLHAARPGITEATLGAFRTPDGRTGYDVLCGALPAGARSVLELGCGNGPLLVALAERVPRLTRIVGVDLCATDLALAQKRLSGDDRIELRSESAQALGLEDASVDAVLSHHALYLFDPIEPVLDHVRRVLVPGGALSFVTVRGDGDRTWTEAMRVFGELTRGDNPHFTGWGDARIWSDEGLRELLIGSQRFRDLRIEPFDVGLCEATPALVERLMRFFYSVDLQRPETRERLRRAWTEILGSDAEGRARFTFPSAIVTAT